MAEHAPAELSTVPPAMRILATNEKVTGPPGLELLRQACGNPSAEPWDVLDNATGGGVLVSQILSMGKKFPESVRINKIVAGDIDERMLDYVHKRSHEESWTNVEVKHLDQTAIPYPDGLFQFVFNNFGVFFHPNDHQTIAEAYRTLKPGGIAGFASWKSITWWPEIALPAMRKFLPQAPALPEKLTVFPTTGWTEVASVLSKLEGAGFQDVKSDGIRIYPCCRA